MELPSRLTRRLHRTLTSLRHRALEQTLDEAVALAAEDVADGNLNADSIGFSIGTTNKHFNKLAQIHAFMRTHVGAAPVIDFALFTVAIDEDEREARKRYTREQGEALFKLPPWTGCQGTGERLEAGKTVIHDGPYFVLLLVWYTGARREELCKLMLDDIEHQRRWCGRRYDARYRSARGIMLTPSRNSHDRIVVPAMRAIPVIVPRGRGISTFDGRLRSYATSSLRSCAGVTVVAGRNASLAI